MHWHPINPIHSHTVAICRIVLCCCGSHLTSSLPSSQFYWHLCPRPRRQSDRKVPTLLASAAFQAVYTSWAKSRAFQHLKLKLSWKLYIYISCCYFHPCPTCLSASQWQMTHSFGWCRSYQRKMAQVSQYPVHIGRSEQNSQCNCSPYQDRTCDKLTSTGGWTTDFCTMCGLWEPHPNWSVLYAACKDLFLLSLNSVPMNKAWLLMVLHVFGANKVQPQPISRPHMWQTYIHWQVNYGLLHHGGLWEPHPNWSVLYAACKDPSYFLSIPSPWIKPGF